MSNDFLWWRDGVIYQIYPRSFADSNNDGIGDLNGIISKLEYLKDLGIDAIWLSPIYPSPNVDFGYDISNYKDIDPIYGSLADFDHLVEEAHQRGIHIIMDLVLNHTSDQHPWFKEARKSRENPYHDWYVWRNPVNGKVPNNWQSVFGGKAWEWVPELGQYYLHMFYKEQPDVNWRNPEVRKAMLDVFRFWADRGVDGFRLDVFNLYFKSDRFEDNPPKAGIRAFDRQRHIHDVDQPEMIPLLQDIRAILDQYPERYAVGETFEASAEKAAAYVGKDRLHAAFDFTFLLNRWRAGSFLRSIERWDTALGEGAWPNYVLNNHDNPRSATRYTHGENDERLKVAAALLLTQRGTPFLYYGEEIGMRDIHISRDMIQDPVGKKYWPFYVGRDGCRAPMQWSADKNAGFGAGTPWLPPHPDHVRRNVEQMRQTPDSLLYFYRKLIQLRKQYPALREGMFQTLTFDPRWMMAYLRQTKDQTILVALNFSHRPMRLVLGGALLRHDWTLLLSNRHSERPHFRAGTLPLLGFEALIMAQND